MHRLALTASVVVLAAASPYAALAGNSAVFQDSVGEKPSAPDITRIAVSNDDAGLISFQIDIANRPAFTSDMAITIYLDTACTGVASLYVADYAVEFDPGVATLYRWNGSDFARASRRSTSRTRRRARRSRCATATSAGRPR